MAKASTMGTCGERKIKLELSFDELFILKEALGMTNGLRMHNYLMNKSNFDPNLFSPHTTLGREEMVRLADRLVTESFNSNLYEKLVGVIMREFEESMQERPFLFNNAGYKIKEGEYYSLKDEQVAVFVEKLRLENRTAHIVKHVNGEYISTVSHINDLIKLANDIDDNKLLKNEGRQKK